LLLLERRRYGLSGTGYMIFEFLQDSLPLDEAWFRFQADRATVSVWVERLGQLLRTMHDRGVTHRDLKPSNVFLQGVTEPKSAVPVLLDLVGTELFICGVPTSRRRKNLARLNAGFLPEHVPNPVRLRLLLAYLGRDRAAWKTWWTEIKRLSQAKWQQARQASPVVR
jgi:hypothetical protein